MSWTFTDPIQPSPNESCDASKNYQDGFFAPPDPLVVAPSEGRLIWPLRAAARTDPPTMLALSAACYVMAARPTANLPGVAPPEPPFPPSAPPAEILLGGLAIVGANRTALAQAFADICVSGRGAYSSFTGSSPNQASIASAVTSLLTGVSGVDSSAIQSGVQLAVARANVVAACLGAVQPDKATRSSLGWIALSAEDDPPRRPVNISTLPYPQYDLVVSVPTQSGGPAEVAARYVVISDHPTPNSEPVFGGGGHILLFVHGDGSRCEEIAPLVEPLLAAGAGREHPYTIVAVDLPSHGCSTMIDPFGPVFAGTPPWDNQAPSGVSRPPNYPVLEFLENFILAFVATLDAKYGVGHRFVGPMGGSLGGNMTLRLARANAAWIRCAMAWSPACVWNSLADDLIKQAGPNHCSTEGHLVEAADTRTGFFFDVFDASTNLAWFQLVAPQGDYWYRDDWQPCKNNLLAAARLERRELYNRIYRQFHYRMDWEQLLYSFNDNDPGSDQPRYNSFRAHLLLAAGAADNKSPATDIYDSARTLGQSLESTKTSGRTLFLEDTGHSIHDERPNLMAAQLDAFVATFMLDMAYSLRGLCTALSIDPKKASSAIVRLSQLAGIDGGTSISWRKSLEAAPTI